MRQIMSVGQPSRPNIPVLVGQDPIGATTRRRNILRATSIRFTFRLIVRQMSRQFIRTVMNNRIRSNTRSTIIRITQPNFITNSTQLRMTQILPRLPVIIRTINGFVAHTPNFALRNIPIEVTRRNIFKWLTIKNHRRDANNE